MCPSLVTQTLASEVTVSAETVVNLEVNNNRILYTPVIQPIAGLIATPQGPTPLGAATTLTATVTQGYPVYYHWDFGDGEKAEGSGCQSLLFLSLRAYSATVIASNGNNQMVAFPPQVEIDQPRPQGDYHRYGPAYLRR